MFRKRSDGDRSEQEREREKQREAAKAKRTKQALTRAEMGSLRDNRRNADEAGWRHGGSPGI